MKKDLAKKLFESGCNCSQAVACAYCEEVGIDHDKLANLAFPFGGGIARSRETCGAVTGMLMVLGCRYPDKTKDEVYTIARSYMDKFQQQFGSCNCGALLSGVGLGVDTSTTSEPRTEQYYAVRPCAEYVAYAAHLLETELDN